MFALYRFKLIKLIGVNINLNKNQLLKSCWYRWNAQMQQNTTAENKFDGNPSYTQVRPVAIQDPNGTQEDDNRIVAPTKVVRPTSILPPLKKT